VRSVLDLRAPHPLKGAQPAGWIRGELLRGVLGLLEKRTENVVEIEKNAGDVFGQITLLMVLERTTVTGRSILIGWSGQQRR